MQNEVNKHMLADPWLVEHKPTIYWNMLQTAEQVAKRYKIAARAHGRVRRRQPAEGQRGAEAGKFDDEIVADHRRSPASPTR